MSSRVDAAEVLAMQADLAATPKFSSRNILADLSAVTDFQVTSKTFAEYTRRVTDSERAAPISKTRRVALVSPTKNTFGISRMFVSHTDNIAGEYRVFHDIETAIAWLTEK